MLIRAIRTSQSFSQVTESWANGGGSYGEAGGASTIKYSTDAELQSARNSSRARCRPDGGFLPRDIAENPTSLTVGSTRDVRRETNLGTYLSPSGSTPLAVFRFRSAFSIFKCNRTWGGTTKGELEAIYCSRIQLSGLTTGRWARARCISPREHRDRCFSERFILFFCIMYNMYPILSLFHSACT